MYRTFKEKIKKIEFVNQNLFYLILSNDNKISYEPGHCFSIKIPIVNINREYSICSNQADEELVFLIRRIEGGLFSNYVVDNLTIGDELFINGPYGEFFFPKLKSDNQYFNRYFLISTGTGIAPYISYLKNFKELGHKILLVHGIRLLEDSVKTIDIGQKYIPCISQEQSSYFNGRVGKYISNIEVDGNDCFYLCGNRIMISDVYDILVDQKKIPPNNIISETFF